MAEKLFEFSGVTTKRVKDVTLTIHKKDKVIIFGPSGAGKSSLLLLFNRLQIPIEGTINFRERLIDSYDVIQLRKEVGLVLQEANLFPGTVRDNLSYGPSLFGKWNEKLGEELMRFVSLPVDYLEREAKELSGGEQQRVNLARTIANQPEVLLLDEPTSALDNKTAEEIEELLLKLAKDQKKTIILVTHNLEQAKRIGEIGVFMDKGRIIEIGNLKEMLEKPESKQLDYFLRKKSDGDYNE